MEVIIAMRQVIIYPGEDGFWVAECPSLPGCISQGKTKEEAITNIKKRFEDTLPHWRKMTCLSQKSALRHWWWRYEQGK
jgi:hypothetical protein